MSLLIVNLLPKDDPAALAAIDTLGAALAWGALGAVRRMKGKGKRNETV